jgi:hypothetical protein
MALKTRQPTGRAGWPKILVEGTDKAGKSWSLATLSASPKVGRTVVLVLGEDETRWDEYGKIPGARFELAVHDGTWSSIMEAVTEAKAEAAAARDAGQPPFVFGIDTMTAVWEGLKDWATLRARGSKKNKALLAADPDAEIDVTSNYWNDARGRHRALMRHLLTFPGIVVLIARGSEVTLFANGQPVANRKTWSVDGEKNLPFDVSTHIRLSREDRPLLVSSSGLHCQIRPGIDPPRRLPDDWSLESVIFDMLKLDAATAEVRDFTSFRQELTPEQVRDEALKPETTFGRIRELYALADRSFPAVEVDGEPLLPALKRIGDERRAAASQQRDTAPAEVAHAPRDVSEPEVADEARMIQAAPAPAQDERPWLDVAAELAAALTSEAAAGKLWREAVDKAHAGEITADDVRRIQDLAGTRVTSLRKTEQAALLDQLPEGDNWRAKVEELADEESARNTLLELGDVLRAGKIDKDRANLVSRAIIVVWPKARTAAEAERAA